jgi:capsular polysaccharide biosynthesis protein
MAIFRSEKKISKIVVKNNLPSNIVNSDLYLFEQDIKKELPDVFVHFAKAINVTPHGIIFKRFHIFKQFLIWPSHEKEFNLFYLIRNYISRKKLALNATEKYIICFDYWSMGYFHWMCDFLPKLIVAEDYLADYTLVLPYNHKYSYITDSLRIFKNLKFVRFSDDQYVSCLEALIPDKVSPSGDNNPMIMQKLKKSFLSFYNSKIDPDLVDQNIYVSRSKAKGRFVINEKEVIETVESMGFKTIRFEEYSLEDQIKLAVNCKNLIGLHGANLTNLMFMNPNSNILELRNEGDVENNYYYSLASTFNLNYFYLQCRSEITKDKQTFNVYVNIDELKNIILKMQTK